MSSHSCTTQNSGAVAGSKGFEHDGGEEALAAGAELEVVGRAGAVAGLERASPREEERLHIPGEELAARIAGAERDPTGRFGPALHRAIVRRLAALEVDAA